jgi:hypothetical protein
MLVLWGNGDLSTKLETMKPSEMLSPTSHLEVDLLELTHLHTYIIPS